jgi:transcriptional regulator with XRE-family HTH domain
MDFFEKLYIARSLLSLNQKEAAEQAGISQVAIGNLERGERNAIPVAYANFLYKKGVDLNWLFNNKDKNDVNVFRKEENINDSTDKLSGQDDDTNIFINHQLLETIHLTYTLTKHLEKLHTELSKMKRLNKIIKIKPRVIKLTRKIQDNK